MNKKILIYYSQLNIGGAEKSLLRLMNKLVADGNDVTLLTRYGGGALEPQLDARIHRIALCRKMPKAGSRLLRTALLPLCGAERAIRLLQLKRSRKRYDLVLIGLQGLDPAAVLNNVKADRYCICIRSDLKGMQSKDRVLHTLRRYADRIDSYLCVSGTARDSLVELIPKTKERAFVLYNILNPDQMRKMADSAENPFPDDGRFHIASVCRISDSAKGVFRMLNVAERLAKENRRFRWYLVGDGPDRNRLCAETEKRGMTDIFLLTGAKENPFGYYRYADLVAVPSYHEGLCGVVNEAKVSGAAVLATEFSGIHEQITTGVNGWIVENSEDAVLSGIRTLMDDPNLLSSIRNTVYPREILDDEWKLKKLYEQMKWD